MFRVESGGSRRRVGGFFEFFDEDVIPLLQSHRRLRGEKARLIAHHVIAPALAPGDMDAFQQVADGTIDVSEVVGPDYRRRIMSARQLGCVTTRLQIMHGDRETTPLDGPILTWDRDICVRINAEAGEGCKVAWWDEQKGPMANALAGSEGPALLQNLMDGVDHDIPVGGHWTVYGDMGMQDPLVVAEVMYSKAKDEAIFEGFDVYSPNKLTQETRRYMDFWRDVHLSVQASATMLDIKPIP